MASNLFIKRPKFAIVISLVIILAGIIAMKSLPLEEYPNITPPQVVVSAQYPGASADVVADTIAAPLEAQINGVEDMIYMTSSSQNGSYTLNLYFEIGSDPDMAVINVQNRLQLVTPRLPDVVRRYGLTVVKTTGGPGLLMISVNSPHNTYDPLYISNYASIYVKDELARIKGVGSVQVFGSEDYSMRIWLNANKMATLGISTTEVYSAISNQNTQVPAGDIGIEPLKNKQMIKLTLRTKGRLKDAKEFENIVVRSKIDGSQVRIKDIARVELGAESYSFFSRIQGKDTAIIMVKQLPEANSIDLANKVKKRLAQLSKGFPPGLEYQVFRDETDFVRESINEVKNAIFLAVILVVIVCYLFLGSMRASLIPFFAIPVSLIGTFIFVSLLGFSINLLLLFGMVLAVGLVVDDAIVVLENTQRHIQDGVKPKEATEITMGEVTGAIIATSMVLMAVFVPVCFMPGITGRMYQQFAVCIAVSIGLSMLVALTLAPALCSTILQSKEEFKELEFLVKFDNWFNGIREKYLTGARYFVENSKYTVMLLGGLILMTVFLFKLIPTSFLPDEDKGAIFTQIQLPDGSSASRTDIVAHDIEKKIQKIKGIEQTLTLVGFSGENTCLIVNMLEPWSKRKKASLSAQGILAQLRKEFGNYPDAIIVSFSPPSIPGLSMFGGFEYQLLDKGNRTPQDLYTETMKFISAANQNSSLQSVYTQYSADLPQLLIDVDVSKAMAQNVDINEIYNTMSAQFGRTYINDFNKYGRVYRVMMQADEDFRAKSEDISKIFVKNMKGGMVPLTAVVNIRSVTGPYTLTRFNMYPAVTINGNAAKGISSGQAMETMEELSNDVLPKNMGYAWSGISLQEEESGGQIGGILGMALIFVYLFLVALYESWTLPMAVMLISPVAIVGGLFFQYVSGYSLDIYSQIGLIMLIGMSTKQAILIIEFAKEARENQNLSIQEAAMEAAKLRFRAVMMTAIAFILGVLPLVTASGAGAESRHSVGMTVFGGMIAVAFAGTLLVPAFYVVIEKVKSKFLKMNNNQ
ncbi:MAG: multidrug efflux RND transporter permease subunit [Candidatus Gastranaerophilales bacterium]|nr:multidrug efflux RND transporter permease subunit [Candidatus Gastranaerophilales bacterium]